MAQNKIDDLHTTGFQENEMAILSESNRLVRTRKNSLIENIPLQQWSSHLIKKVIVIWLEPNLDASEIDYRQSTVREWHITDSVEIFTEVDQCIDFLCDCETARIFFVLSDTIGETVMPLVHGVPELDSIYIVSNKEATMPQPWMNNYKKIKGIYNELSSMYDQLKRNIKQYEQDFIPHNIPSASSAADLNELDPSFMYSQLLKETLLEMNDDAEARNKFFEFYRARYSDDLIRLTNIDRIERTFNNHSPIWWYNNEITIYSMVNRALQTQDIAGIVQIRYYIRALHYEIEHIYKTTKHSERFTVYRGKVLTRMDFEKIKNNKGHLISFNKFISASFSSEIACCYADIGKENLQSIGVIFQLIIDPSVSPTPYALLDDPIKFRTTGNEVLFSMHAAFRIDDIEEVTGNLWTVTLTLTSETDEELSQLTKRMREELGELSGFHRLGKLLIKMGEFDKAESVFLALLESTSEDDLEKNAVVHAQFGSILRQKGNFSDAILHFQKALEIHSRISLSNNIDLTYIYNNMGRAYLSLGNFSSALSCYETILEILKKSLPWDHPDLATIYNSIGRVHSSMGNYPLALSFYEKTIDIQQKFLPTNHPDIAITFKNIGKAHYSMGYYAVARSYYEKTLEIQRKTLPPSHPELAITYNHIGQVSNSMKDYSSALSYYEKTVNIQETSLPSNHPDLAMTYNDIGKVYNSMGDYPSALSYYEKALNIQQNSLPPDHPDLANTYENMGKIYHVMGNSMAIDYYQRTLDIQFKSLPPNHPDLAITHNSIGRVYYSINDSSSALVHYDKALEIQKESLPSDHPDLLDTYNNIAEAHVANKEYLDAIPYYKKALKIQQISLPSDHSSLSITYSKIAHVHELRQSYSNALYYYQQASKTQEKVPSPDYPSLAITHSNIGEMHRLTGDYAASLPNCEKALEIQMKYLPSIHPSLAVSHYRIAKVLEGFQRYKEAAEHASRAFSIACHSSELNQSQIDVYKEYLDHIINKPEYDDLIKSKSMNEWTYPLLLIIPSAEKSTLHSVLYDLTDGHLAPPIQTSNCLTILKSNQEITSVVLELSTNSNEERDHLVKEISAIDHIESIYLLGKPIEIREDKDKFFTAFYKVTIFCEDVEELAVRWALNTAHEYRKLGGQYAKDGNKDFARECFQRGKKLYDRLGTLIHGTRP